LITADRKNPVYPDAARSQHTYGTINLLLTLDTEGSVVHAGALAGPDVCGKPPSKQR